MQTLEEKKQQAVWIAHSLFERGKTSGTTANLSFSSSRGRAAARKLEQRAKEKLRALCQEEGIL